MSQFLYLYRMTDAARQENMGTPERAQQSMQRWMAWMNDLDKKGHLKDRGQPLERTGKVVRGQQKTVTDGPFTEAKDLVGGFTLVEARDIDQAVELSRGCPILEGGGFELLLHDITFHSWSIRMAPARSMRVWNSFRSKPGAERAASLMARISLSPTLYEIAWAGHPR